MQYSLLELEEPSQILRACSAIKLWGGKRVPGLLTTISFSVKSVLIHLHTAARERLLEERNTGLPVLPRVVVEADGPEGPGAAVLGQLQRLLITLEVVGGVSQKAPQAGGLFLGDPGLGAEIQEVEGKKR